MGDWDRRHRPRTREMRQVLVRWQRSGLALREFGQQRGIPLSTLTWWPQVFRRAGEQMNAASKSVPASDAVVFIEVPQPATVPNDTIRCGDRPAQRACGAAESEQPRPSAGRHRWSVSGEFRTSASCSARSNDWCLASLGDAPWVPFSLQPDL
jgi:hypothetical protein